MGSSTDAILFYGFHGEECAWDDVLGDDWEMKLAAKSGLAWPSNGSGVDEQRAFWKAKRAIIDAEPCEICIHCSESAPMPFACVKASMTRTSRGDAREISSLSVDPTWNVALRAFADKMDLTWQAPRWWLVSYWSE